MQSLTCHASSLPQGMRNPCGFHISLETSNSLLHDIGLRLIVHKHNKDLHHLHINPLSAMVAIWHNIIVSFKVLGTERIHCNLDTVSEKHHREVNCGKECLLIGGCRLNGL